MTAHGPRRKYVLLTLLTLATWMEGRDDEILVASPSLEEISAGCCLSVRTVRKHLRTAEREGWLIIDTTCDPPEYRCALPERIADRTFHVRRGHLRRLPDGRLTSIEYAVVSRREM